MNLRFSRVVLAWCAGFALVATAEAAQARKEPRDDTAATDGSTRNLYMMLIRQARDDGRPRAALAYLDDFDRRHPDDIEAQLLRVNCLLDLGQTDLAETALGAISGQNGSGEVLAVRGHVAAARSDWPGAVHYYMLARKARPADALIGNALGFAQLQIRQPALAVETLRGALDLLPGNVVIRNNLGLALTIAGRAAEAEALLAKVRDTAERKRLRSSFASEALRVTALPAQAERDARP